MKITQKSRKIQLAILFILVLSCSVVSRPSVAPTKEAFATLETQIHIVTSTVVNHVPDWLLPENSINLSNDVIEHSTLPGSLVLTINNIPYLFRLNTGILDSSIQYENTDMYLYIQVTKNKFSYEYNDTKALEDSVMIRNLEGDRFQRIPINLDEWNCVYYWANPDSLVLANCGSLQSPLVIYNTQSHQYRYIPMDYPEIAQLDLFSWRMWPALGAVSPDLSKLVYLGVNKLIVQDLISNRKIFVIDDVGDIIVDPPIWSPDGEHIAIIKNIYQNNNKIRIDNLYIAKVDGRITNITDLEINDGFTSVDIVSYQWSPSGQKLAFWVSAWSDYMDYHGHQLAIADASTGLITLYNIFTPVNFPKTPVWSEDEKYIAVTITKDETERENNSYIFCLTDNKTYTLPANAIVYGWVTIP